LFFGGLLEACSPNESSTYITCLRPHPDLSSSATHQPAAFACVWGLVKQGNGLPIGMGISGGVAVLATVVMHVTCKSWYTPVYSVPLFPYTPAFSYMLNCMMMASLPANAYVQVRVLYIWSAAALLRVFLSSSKAARQLSVFLSTQRNHPHPGLNPRPPPPPPPPPVMIAFYLVYSIHAAQFFDEFLGREGTATQGKKPADLEARGAAVSASLQRALSHRSSFVNPFTGVADLRREIGRASGGVTYLPPATLPS